MDRIYLDHNATTPVDPAVVQAMEPYLREIFGNPSSVEHEDGHVAARAVATARVQVAEAIGARENEIIFTGSCTEADNLAIFGVARANPEKKHLVTTVIEHPAILEPARALEREGWRITFLPVDADGRVSVEVVAQSLCDDTALVSVMAANNEVGSLQPIGEIGALCAARDIIFHTDLAQVAACGDIDVERDNIHLASLSAHKAYGPKGIGALYVRSRRPRVKLAPMLFGGGQERGLRPGTLNTAGIVGMGAAMAIARKSAKAESARLSDLCSEFRDLLLAHVAGAVLNGHPTERLPNNLSFSIPGLEPLALMRSLRDHLSFSASSACATDKIETSHVLLAMFGDTERARGAFRIAPGRFTTEAQMRAAASLIIDQCALLRRSPPVPMQAIA
ncbi:cysteine desulfurase [Sphingobium sp. B1D7B]|uniref:cysteine desulfurase family protein n=1 Tax=Sphingobium sp. B1D7B TaxID=2940578 RepID=UPI00222456DC|nr:aminotransferase class V-fold PLP-dependent enzyme [Sphingobium sp. B1D7B]MCW2406057.1 cysteine desulfurase [Sphingobium sp. B1D7B]